MGCTDPYTRPPQDRADQIPQFRFEDVQKVLGDVKLFIEGPYLNCSFGHSCLCGGTWWVVDGWLVHR